MLCSLRVVPVSSEHFLGRRYVMELATASRARELRVFRSLELLMVGVADLGLPQMFERACITDLSMRDAVKCLTLSCDEHEGALDGMQSRCGQGLWKFECCCGGHSVGALQEFAI